MLRPRPQLDLMLAHVTGAHGVFTALKKAGVACLEHTAEHGRWEILWILTPKMLRQLARLKPLWRRNHRRRLHHMNALKSRAPRQPKRSLAPND